MYFTLISYICFIRCKFSREGKEQGVREHRNVDKFEYLCIYIVCLYRPSSAAAYERQKKVFVLVDFGLRII